MLKELNDKRNRLIESIERVVSEYTAEQKVRFEELREFFGMNDLPLRLSTNDRRELINKLMFRYKKSILERLRPLKVAVFEGGKLDDATVLWLELKFEMSGQKELDELEWLMARTASIVDRVNYYLAEFGISQCGVRILKGEVEIEKVVPDVDLKRIKALRCLQKSLQELEKSGFSQYQIQELFSVSINGGVLPFKFFI
jgi:hypothetical protein